MTELIVVLGVAAVVALIWGVSVIRTARRADRAYAARHALHRPTLDALERVHHRRNAAGDYVYLDDREDPS